MGISEPSLYYKLGLKLIWCFVSLKQIFHNTIGMNRMNKVAEVRALLDDQLKGAGISACKYRFSKVHQ